MCRTDRHCIRLCLAGRPAAFRHLVVRHQGRLMSYLSVRLGDEDEAAEVTQETLVRAYFALGKLRKPDSFFSWLLGIAGRVVKETRREQQRRRQWQVATSGRNTTGVQGRSPDPPVRQAVADLPEVYRQAVLLRYYGGLSCTQISDTLGVPLGTVTKRLSRAYALLREALRAHQE